MLKQLAETLRKIADRQTRPSAKFSGSARYIPLTEEELEIERFLKEFVESMIRESPFVKGGNCW